MLSLKDLALEVEEKMGGVPQDIEGCYCEGKIWVVQTRPQVTAPWGSACVILLGVQRSNMVSKASRDLPLWKVPNKTLSLSLSLFLSFSLTV